jgi:DNA-binding transcriptional LysR family regulator
VLQRFYVQYPGVSFNVRMSSTDEAMEALANGVAEIGLILNPPVRDAIAITEVFRDRLVAAFAANHPLAKRKIVSAQELARYPMVLTEPSFGLRQQIDRTLARHGVRPETSCVTNSLALVKSVCSVGQQCTVLPRFAVAGEVAAGVLGVSPLREFANDPLIFGVCTLAGRSISPAATVFIETVIDYCRRYRR